MDPTKQPNPKDLLGAPATKPSPATTPPASPSELMSAAPSKPSATINPAQPPSAAALMSNPAVQQTAKDSMLGRAARELFTGEQTQYRVAPDGTMQAVQVKEKPGQLFRNILAGALLGGMAGSRAPKDTGFLGGFAAGGSAEIANNERQDLLKREEAQQDFRNQSTLQKERNQAFLNNARIILMNAQNLRADRDLDLHSRQFLDDVNFHNQRIAVQLAKAGAKVAQIPHNGEMGNGAAMLHALQQDRSILKSPSGMQRVWTLQVNYSGLKFGESGRWEDAKTGQPVDLADRTAWTAYDVEPSVLKQQVSVSGSDLNAMGYQAEPNQRYKMTMSDFLAMQRTALDAKSKKSEFAVRERLLNKRTETSRRIKDLEEQRQHLESLASYGGDDPTAKKNAKDAAAKIPGIQSEIDSLLGIQPSPNNPPPVFPNGHGAKLTDRNIWNQFLNAAGGDSTKAEQLAHQNGWK